MFPGMVLIELNPVSSGFLLRLRLFMFPLPIQSDYKADLIEQFRCVSAWILENCCFSPQHADVAVWNWSLSTTGTSFPGQGKSLPCNVSLVFLS